MVAVQLHCVLAVHLDSALTVMYMVHVLYWLFFFLYCTIKNFIVHRLLISAQLKELEFLFPLILMVHKYMNSERHLEEKNL